MSNAEACPCGSGRGYDRCCGPLHRGEASADTPEQLMRSRYAAFSLGNGAYLVETWHPRSRPPDFSLDPDLTWLSLQIVEVSGTEVEFIARYSGPGGRGFVREKSQFARHRGRWYYLSGVPC